MRVCSACGEQNPDKAKFCLECGAPLAEAPPRHEERKIVTVLFADLVGFTGRSERMDVEDVRGTLQPYHALLRRELERHGGTVEKFIGDAVMALFGAPVAHEDDAERTVRAALAIQDAVAGLRQQDKRLDLHVRIGVNTGEALIALGARPAEGEGMASGDVVNTASRLQAAAPVDGVLVGEHTYRSTSRAIVYEPSAPVQAKGKADPVPAWIAVGPVSAVPEQARQTLPLVGREHERGVLLEALGRCREGPAAQLVTLIGPPGIGKTRLIDELYTTVEALPELITWRRGRSLAYGDGVALWALGEMVKSHAGILESDTADAAASKLEAAVRASVLDPRDYGWVQRHLTPLVGVDDAREAADESTKAEAFAAWRRFFEAMAEARPTVMVFEDVHWADDTLLDFVDVLAERAGAVPLLIVCAARPELLDRRPTWGGGKVNSATIGLGPLTAASTARLVGEILGQGVLPEEVQQVVLERAEGNPLYAQEFVRMLSDQGVLRSGASGWSLDGDMDGLPESIGGIVAARLDGLSAAEKALVQDAAVVGKTAWVGAVCAVVEREPWHVDELLHGLERAQILQRARRSSIQGQVEFRFAHMVTRDVAYSQIPRAARARKHEAVAVWIESLAEGRGDKAELLASHYCDALRLREQLGDDTSMIAERARTALTQAGNQAAAVYAHASAARHYAAALALTASADMAARAPLLLGRATALWILDDEGAPAALDEAAPALCEVGAWEGAARAERMLGHWYAHHEGRMEEAEEHYARAAELVSRVPPCDLLCVLTADQCLRMLRAGEIAEALRLLDQVLPTAEAAGLVTGQALLRSVRGYARVMADDPGGTEDGRAGAAVLAREGHRSAAASYNNLAEGLRGLGDMAGANEAYAAAVHVAERLGGPVDWLSAERALQEYHAGCWDAALDGLAHLNVRNEFTKALVCSVRGRILLARGDAGGALADATVTVEFATATENGEALYTGLSLAAPCLAALGRHADARASCDRFLDRWIVGGALTGRAIDLCELAAVLAAAGRGEDIRAAARALAEVSRWRVPLLMLADGRPADAAAAYAEIGSKPLAAAAHLHAAHQATTHGQAAEAAEHGHRALSFYRQVEATAYIREVEALVSPARTAGSSG